MEWLYEVVVDPYDYPQGWFAYLALPVIGSAILGWMKPTPNRSMLIALWPFISVFAYFALYIWLYGMSSTISIGVMFAFVVFSIACWITFEIARRMRAGFRR